MTQKGIDSLQLNHDDTASVFHSLTADEWAVPSACAGWRVQDVAAHITSLMKFLVDPDPLPEPAGEDESPGAEDLAEILVAPRRAWSPDQVLDEYDRLVEPFLAALRAMQDEPVASYPADLGDLGTHPTHILADTFCFDTYCHLRIDILQPGGPIDREVAPPDDLRLRPGIDWMLAGLPQMCRDGLGGVDRPLQLRLTGPGGGQWQIGPPGDDGLVTVDEGTGDAPVTVTSSAHDFVSWGTQRSDWRGVCSVSGDAGYAATVLDVINII